MRVKKRPVKLEIEDCDENVVNANQLAVTCNGAVEITGQTGASDAKNSESLPNCENELKASPQTGRLSGDEALRQIGNASENETGRGGGTQHRYNLRCKASKRQNPVLNNYVTEPSRASRSSKLGVGRREAASKLPEVKTANVVKRRGRARLASPSTTSALKPTSESSGCETQLEMSPAAKRKKSRISCAHRKEGVQQRPDRRGDVQRSQSPKRGRQPPAMSTARNASSGKKLTKKLEKSAERPPLKEPHTRSDTERPKKPRTSCTAEIQNLIARIKAQEEKAKTQGAKIKEREARAAERLERRKQEIEEKERRKKERLARKEMKEKLLQQRRERREEERKRKAAMKQQTARRRRKNDTVIENEFDSKNMAILSPCDGILPLVDLSAFWRIFVPGKVFLNRWMILDEIPSHRYGVMAYLVVEKSEAATEGILYAQLMDSSYATLTEEMYFLQSLSEKNRSSMFQTIVEARYIDYTAQSPPFFYAVVLLRESVSLSDLWNGFPQPAAQSGERKSWSLGTVGRLAADILEILEIACESGYTFRNMEMSHFHLDVRTRRLYLNNACEVVKSTELMDLNLKDGRTLPHNHWRGGAEYAPLNWHNKGQQSVVRVSDCAEALFYMMLEMMGLMTWRGLTKDEIKRQKERIDLSMLPPPLAEYLSIVRRAQKVEIGKDMFQDGYLLLNGRRGGATSSVLDFRRLFSKLISVYKIFGRMLDDDTPYDFDVVQDVVGRGPEQAYLIELFKKVHLLAEKVQLLKADIYSLTVRKEFARRIAAQTRREQAAFSAQAAALSRDSSVAG